MLLATQYFRPPFPDRAFWERDLALMRESGLNGVQLWMLWSWAEATPGEYDFADYDELVRLAAKNDLKVVLSVQCELQPHWIHRVVPDSHLVDHRGNAIPSSNRSECNFGLTPGGCYDNPAVLERMGGFLREAARRYAREEHVAAWDCWNEMRWNVQSDAYVCYCEHSVARFREWLADRYGDLAGLNRAWHAKYSDWLDVHPGRRPGRDWAPLVEFCRFLHFRARDHARWLYATIRGEDATHPIVAHNGGPSWTNAGSETNQPQSNGNDWEVADELDGYGFSSFPYWGKPWDDAAHASRLECMRSVAGEKPFWASELQGGAAGHGFTVMPPVDGASQGRWILNGISRGAKGTIHWCWRDEVFSRESGGFGIVGNDGEIESRLADFRELGACLAEHEAFFDSYAPDPPEAGVYMDPAAAFVEFSQEGHAWNCVAGWDAYSLALARAGAHFEFVDAGHLERLEGLKLLFAPVPIVIRPSAADPLAEFVEGGGTLVVEGELDAFDENGFYRYPGAAAGTPGSALGRTEGAADDTVRTTTHHRDFAARLGIAEVGRRALPEKPVTIKLGGKSLRLAASGWTTPYAGSDGRVLARGAGRKPLAIMETLGAGRVLALGGFYGRPYLDGASTQLGRFVEALMELAGVAPAFKVTGKGEVSCRSGRAKEADGGDARMVFVMNNGPKQVVKLSGAAESVRDYKGATELVTGRRLAVAAKTGTLSVPVPAKGAAVLRLES